MLDLLLASDSRAFVQDLLVYGLAVVAIFWGAKPERAAIAIWWLCFEVPDLIFTGLLDGNLSLTGVDTFLATKDIAAATLWTLLALYANRNYPLWIAGSQLLAVSAHLTRGLVDAISPLGYSFMVVAPGWIQLVAMSIGFARHIIRKRKYGEYRDWRIIRKPLDFEALAQGAGLHSTPPTDRSETQDDTK